MKLATTTGDFTRYFPDTESRIRALYRAGFRHIDLSLYRDADPASVFTECTMPRLLVSTESASPVSEMPVMVMRQFIAFPFAQESTMRFTSASSSSHGRIVSAKRRNCSSPSLTKNRCAAGVSSVFRRFFSERSSESSFAVS